MFAGRGADAGYDLRMAHDHEATVTIAQTRSIFEADTIAAALRSRGVDARVMNAATNAVWGGMFTPAAVMVLASEEAAARLALEEIKSEVSQIDWEQAVIEEPGAGEGRSVLREPSRARQWMWTLVVILVPAGLFVLSYGVNRSDPAIQAIGGTLVLCALVMGAYLMMPERE